MTEIKYDDDGFPMFPSQYDDKQNSDVNNDVMIRVNERTRTLINKIREQEDFFKSNGDVVQCLAYAASEDYNLDGVVEQNTKIEIEFDDEQDENIFKLVALLRKRNIDFNLKCNDIDKLHPWIPIVCEDSDTPGDLVVYDSEGGDSNEGDYQ